MILALAITGLVAGIAGLSLALVAHNRVNQVVEECAQILRRQLQTADGSADSRSVRDVAIVQYDALQEMTGHRSFSLALMNAAGDGVVLTSINGRTETRTYAKIVRDGHATQDLSPEEDQVVRAARLGQSPLLDVDDAAEPAQQTSGTRA